MAKAEPLEDINPKTLFEQPFAFSMGPQRSGTSWLDRYLRAREDVCLPKDVKEVFYFDRHFERGTAFYTGHFNPEKNQKLIMEISTTSFDSPEAPMRVHDIFGRNVRLLCPLRHPVVRSYSLYLHYLRYGIVKGTLREACFQNNQIIDSSKYAKHIENWLKYFDKDQLHVVFQEDLEHDQGDYIRKVCKALNIPYKPANKAVSGRYNVTTYSHSGLLASTAQRVGDLLRACRLYFVINFAKSIGLKRLAFGVENPDAKKTTIPEEDRLWLEEQFEGEIEKLEKIIGPIEQWRS